MKPRVIVCDEHELEAQGFARLLETDFDVLHVTQEMRMLGKVVQVARPDAVVIGLTKRMDEGLNVVTEIHSAAPAVRIIVITMWDDARVATDAFRRGASAYVLKSSDAPAMIDGVHMALAGRSYVSPSLAGAMIVWLSHAPRHGISLTPRQRDILQLLAGGKSMKEVGARLNLTARTVAFHKYRVMRKFKIETSAGLVRFAIAQGLA